MSNESSCVSGKHYTLRLRSRHVAFAIVARCVDQRGTVRLEKPSGEGLDGKLHAA